MIDDSEVELWLTEAERGRFHATPTEDCEVFYTLAETRRALVSIEWAGAGGFKEESACPFYECAAQPYSPSEAVHDQK